MTRQRPSQKSGRFKGQPYRQGQAYYVKAFGVSPRTVKRWWKEGLPCDDPDKMGEYLSNRGRRSAAQDAPPPAVDDFQEDPPRRAPDDQSDAGAWLAERQVNIQATDLLTGEGIAAAVARISKVELKLAARLDRELNRSDDNNHRELSNKLGLWIGMLKTMGKLEKDTPGILEKHKSQIDIGEVEEGVTKLLIAIVGRLEMLPIRAMQTLAGFTNPLDIREELEKEIADVLAPIRNCEWIPAAVRAEHFPPETETVAAVV